MKSRVPLAAVSTLAVLILAGCGGEPAAVDEPAAAPADGNGTVEVDVSLQDIEFVPDSVDVSSGSTVVFNLSNDGNLEHDLVLEDGTESGIVAPGSSATLEAGPFTSDTMGWCDVPGHREAGMEFQITVTD